MQNSPFKFRAFSVGVAALLGLSFSTCNLLADAVVLKGGERIEGKILSETDTEVTIQFQISASIKDERTVKKSEIEKIEKTTPDVEAWAVLKDFKLSDDSLEPAIYLHYINSLKGFITQFPDSPNAAAAKTALAAIEAEKTRVDGGEYKFDGKWLSKDEVQKERIQILGSAYLSQMKKFAAAGRISEAMASFEQLQKQAAGSASFPEAVELARRTVASLKAAADNGLVKLKAQRVEDQKMVDKLTEPQKSQTARDLKALRDRIDASVAAAERSGAKWLPLNPANERSLAAISSKAGSELSRLNGLQTENMKASIAEVAKVKAALGAGDLAAAEAGAAKAKQLWPGNEQVERANAEIAAAKKLSAEKLAAEKAAAAEAARVAAEEAKKKPVPELAPPPPPEPAAAAPVEEESVKKEEGSIFSSPGFWVLLVVIVVFAAVGRKAFRKFKDPTGNILDQ